MNSKDLILLIPTLCPSIYTIGGHTNLYFSKSSSTMIEVTIIQKLFCLVAHGVKEPPIVV